MGPARLERATSCSGGKRSIQLSYGPVSIFGLRGGDWPENVPERFPVTRILMTCSPGGSPRTAPPVGGSSPGGHILGGPSLQTHVTVRCGRYFELSPSAALPRDRDAGHPAPRVPRRLPKLRRGTRQLPQLAADPAVAVAARRAGTRLTPMVSSSPATKPMAAKRALSAKSSRNTWPALAPSAMRMPSSRCRDATARLVTAKRPNPDKARAPAANTPRTLVASFAGKSGSEV